MVMLWKKLSLTKRLVVLGVIGFVVGSFVQGEVERGEAPGAAVFVAIVVGCFIVIQGFKEKPADRKGKI
ncbi:hypothetical protein PSYMO_26874 [Pseudomonas amygdali pv. mori str. 301020]|uniref:Uncharacterized protein n=2 Tax=Pseudomonas amygdali pv. mori TaxID=34065 RepID=A0A3M5JN47_PSEA0|nr:hypothetical protein [Pseudomonas amygdali]EGH24881.1 hypothetical protein PSYMO_26874 [Pseudomonas amygdali pv. mori str. 301020]RMT24554.1 hypothetical protein ALP52_200092 [Pseudomonas amygdali pv. mori]